MFQSEFNRQQLQTLVSLARTEIERQEIRKEVQEVNELLLLHSLYYNDARVDKCVSKKGQDLNQC